MSDFLDVCDAIRRLAARTMLAAVLTQIVCAEVKLHHEFEKDLGLFSVSSNGALLALEKPLPKEKVVCKLQPCNPYLHGIIVKNAADARTVSDIKIAFEGFRKVTIAFEPGTEDVLLRGRIPGRQEDPTAFFLWSPRTQAIRLVPRPDAPNFEFVRFLDNTHALGTAGTPIVMWDHRSGRITKIPDDSPFRVLDTASVAGLEQDSASQVIHGRALSSDGRVLVVISSATKSRVFPTNPSHTAFYLAVYDLTTNRRVARIPLFEEESRRDQLIDHVARQLAISPDAKAVAFSYEHQKPGFFNGVRRQARFAVYSLPSGDALGIAEHEAETVPEAVAAVVGAASGVLQFGAGATHLYTTTRNTRCWNVRP